MASCKEGRALYALPTRGLDGSVDASMGSGLDGKIKLNFKTVRCGAQAWAAVEERDMGLNPDEEKGLGYVDGTSFEKKASLFARQAIFELRRIARGWTPF
jgi:hypothetical protein